MPSASSFPYGYAGPAAFGRSVPSYATHAIPQVYGALPGKGGKLSGKGFSTPAGLQRLINPSPTLVNPATGGSASVASSASFPFARTAFGLAAGAALGAAASFVLPFVSLKMGAIVGGLLGGGALFATSASLPFGATDVKFAPGESPWGLQSMSIRDGHVRAWDKYGREVVDPEILKETLKQVHSHASRDSMALPPEVVPDVRMAMQQMAAGDAQGAFASLSMPMKIGLGVLAFLAVRSLIK